MAMTFNIRFLLSCAHDGTNMWIDLQDPYETLGEKARCLQQKNVTYCFENNRTKQQL